jgi:hypothetical protein
MKIKSKIAIWHKNKKIDIRISFDIPTKQKLPEISTTLQKHLHIVLADDIGIKNIGKIDIVKPEYIESPYQNRKQNPLKYFSNIHKNRQPLGCLSIKKPN